MQCHIFLCLLLVLLLVATRLLWWSIWASCRPTSSSPCTSLAFSSTWPTSTTSSWATWTSGRPTRFSWAVWSSRRPTRSPWAAWISGRPTWSSGPSRRPTTILTSNSFYPQNSFSMGCFYIPNLLCFDL